MVEVEVGFEDQIVNTIDKEEDCEREVIVWVFFISFTREHTFMIGWWGVWSPWIAHANCRTYATIANDT